MDEEVKKSLADLDKEADALLEKSRKSKAVKKSDDAEVKDEKPVVQDHDADGADASEKSSKVVSDEKDDKSDHTVTHNINKAKKDDDGDEDDVDKSCHTKKSISADLKDNEELKKSMEAGNTAFMSLFAQVQAQALDRLDEKIDKSLSNKNDFVKSVSKAVTTLVKSNESLFDLVKSQDEKIKGLEDTVEKVSHQPLTRKSVQDVHAIEKPFEKSAGLKGNEKLTKSQVQGALTAAVLDRKNTAVSAQDAATYEMTKSLDTISNSARAYIEDHFSK